VGQTDRIDLALQIDRIFQVLPQKRDNAEKLIVWNFEAYRPLGIIHL
jgi:hypothetical protein